MSLKNFIVREICNGENNLINCMNDLTYGMVFLPGYLGWLHRSIYH